ncbi:hypothetical protein [Clostridium algidicarnis]|uniref:hypothetical protein n=1 Tax=Clostridium algidicarnis TaxID=37659 RepID=UPI001C0CE908|nr:hypothetical protein [Clostridium algidicarnis]MBU3210251.1 hypothetical protein [Clostridium algidicarnis]MBU3228678.1 hypothetical protein [Clostridium algidicarnis]MBU3251276.1 hypothetical protein [Clostridium algidicarnis]
MNRKVFKSILVVMLTLLITANITISSKAMGIEQFSNEKVIVNEFIDKYHPGKNYDDIISLYDFNEKISYLLFTLSDSGYVIIDINDKCVVESGTDNNNFIKADTNKYYYNGPCAYFIEKDGMLFDLTSQEYIK